MVIRHERRGLERQHDVAEPCLVAGRDPKCDIVLSDAEVSRRHVYLQVLPDCVYFCDLHSRTGLRLRNRPQREGVLTPADGLHVGPYSLRIDRASADCGKTVRRREFLNSISQRFEVVQSDFPESASANRFPLRQRLTLIGRSEPCHVRLPDERVAPVHCSIVRTRRAFWVLDLHATGGVQPNGRHVSRMEIRPNDRISVGPFELTLSVSPFRDGLRCGTRPQRPVSTSTTTPEPVELREADRTSQGGIAGVSEAMLLAVVQHFQELQKQLILHNQHHNQLQSEVLEAIHRARHEAVLARLNRLGEQVARLETICRNPWDSAELALT